MQHHDNHRIIVDGQETYLLSHWTSDNGIILSISGPESIQLIAHQVTEADGTALILEPTTFERAELARTLASNRSELRKRLNEARSVLVDYYAKRFKKARFDFAHKRLINEDSTLVLQWKLRDEPHKSVSYDNQQTSVGHVELISI